MRNPYEVLEIGEGASEEEIKAAYKRLVRKYHPDQYANNPLSDLAEEKLKEINEAYDFLIKNKGNYTGGQKSNNWGNQQYNNSSSSIYAQVRAYIERGHINQADQILEGITNRNAEWNFLKGIIFLRRGWYDMAYQHIQLAVNLDPTNTEYRAALSNLASRANAYRNVGNNRGYRRDPSFCEICQCLICSDCLCECLGGDLVRCI
ncbi:molecular chaperone DnaJ [Proteiniborus ethanoligenes]|uniref:Molecular chaperone DnaJ n=1 Tax=Proteiniborus ethanoligenes TaxID=415015 RepID=A0A1H3PYD2_9FIRM|nr:J domain-containing protein [Proteiniborus ethanoligenes]TAH62886.1 MAG: molecular chaperone DnaJ [Gottschalkiaceae bacterium]SDZ06147.1 molecular chaperone DnaJ [Proteiniborus ethanoligenes]